MSFATSPDYENPLSTNTSNDYVVIVRSSDSAGNTSDQTLTVTVADADDAAPSITGASGNAGDSTSSTSIAENITAVHTFTANETVTWSMNSGDDKERFAIDQSTGALIFATAPDHETPTDSDSNNTYTAVVKATDTAGNGSLQTITVTILSLIHI